MILCFECTQPIIEYHRYTIYGLPNIPETGKKYRPNVSNFNAPAYKLSKWLFSQFNQLESFDKFSIENAFEFTDNLNGMQFENDEPLISCDIES